MRFWPKTSGRLARSGAVAIVACVALALAGSAAAASTEAAATTSAGQIARFAASLQRIGSKLVTTGVAGAKLRTLRKARAAYVALQPKLESDLPADATPEALAARRSLVALDKEYVRQIDEGLARTSQSPSTQVSEICRLNHHARAGQSVIRITTRFDAAAAVLGTQAGVTIVPLSGDAGDPSVRVDRNRAGVAGLCALTATKALVPSLTRAFATGQQGEIVALTSLTTRALAAARAFLTAREPASGSPYLAVWRAQVAYATTEHTYYSGLTEQATTGRIVHRSLWEHAQLALPDVISKLDREEHAAGLIP
jgi:hypothetical protein